MHAFALIIGYSFVLMALCVFALIGELALALQKTKYAFVLIVKFSCSEGCAFDLKFTIFICSNQGVAI